MARFDDESTWTDFDSWRWIADLILILTIFIGGEEVADIIGPKTHAFYGPFAIGMGLAFVWRFASHRINSTEIEPQFDTAFWNRPAAKIFFWIVTPLIFWLLASQAYRNAVEKLSYEKAFLTGFMSAMIVVALIADARKLIASRKRIHQ